MIIPLTIAITLLTGCATPPEAIVPQYISEITYLNYTCEQLAQEHTRLINALSAASDAQHKARSGDTVGVILLGIPTASLSGSNQAANIARLKGEIIALEKAAIQKNCTSVKPANFEDITAKKKKS